MFYSIFDKKSNVIPQFWISKQSTERQLCGIFDMDALNCFWFVIEETICRQWRDQVHDEVIDRAVSLWKNLLNCVIGYRRM
jgi:hypothetical protein